MRHYVRWGSVSLFYETTTLMNFCSYELMRRCVSRWQSERCSSAFGFCGRYLLGFLFHLRFLIVFTHNYQHRRGSLTSHIAPDLQDSLLADATAGAQPEPIIEPTRDEAGCLQRRRVHGAVRTSVVSSWPPGHRGPYRGVKYRASTAASRLI